MAVRRISQLDELPSSDYLSSNPDFNYLKDDGNVLSNFLFETSELYDYETGHYLSKKMTGVELSAMLLTDILNTINHLSAVITERLTVPHQTEPLIE